MAAPAKLGVFLCASKNGAESIEYKRLRWAAETGSEGGMVFEVDCEGPRACAMEVRDLAATHGVEMAVIGSYPQTNGREIYAHQLAGVGIDEDRIVYLDLFEQPDETSGCKPNSMALHTMCQGLAKLAGRQVPQMEAMEVSTRVMVIGDGVSALLTARDLARQGYDVELVKPAGEGPCTENLLGLKAVELKAGLESQTAGLDKINIHDNARLLALGGAAGWFTARLAEADGGISILELGAVVVAQGPPLAVNNGRFTLTGSDRIITLTSAMDMVRDMDSVRDLAADAAQPRIGLTVGLGAESHPVTFRAALNTARKLAAELDVRVPLFLGNTKVAAPDLEVLSRDARDDGVLFIRLTDRDLRMDVGETINIDYFDEILGRQMTVALDALIVDQTPRPDETYVRQADALGLALGRDGYIQPDKVNALPTLTPRAGVYVVGPAKAAGDLELQIDEAEEAVRQVKGLLVGGSVDVKVDHLTIDRQACAVCLTCVRVCPEGAMGHIDNLPVPSPLACTGCGTCAAECPMDAIQLLGQEDDRYHSQIKAAANRSESGLNTDMDREILVFLCANSASKAMSSARLAGAEWPKGVTFIEVPCASKIDPVYLLFAFNEGFDGVMVASCFENACYSLEGSTWIRYRTVHTQKLLEEAGLDPRRLARVSVAPNMSSEMLTAVEDMRATLDELGPTRLKAGARAKEFLNRFTHVTDQQFTIMN